jgi:disulfide bond formation protein DsbB
MSVETLNYILASGTLVLEVYTVVLLCAYILRRRSPLAQKSIDFVYPYTTPLALGLTGISSALSLYYSDVLGFIPCSLCWFQRVFLYPQVILFAVAFICKQNVYKTGVWISVTALSILGGLVALYQHYLQMGGGSILPCPVSSDGADCAARILFEYNHITYPYMALVLFAFVIVLMLIARSKNHD